VALVLAVDVLLGVLSFFTEILVKNQVF